MTSNEPISPPRKGAGVPPAVTSTGHWRTPSLTVVMVPSTWAGLALGTLRMRLGLADASGVCPRYIDNPAARQVQRTGGRSGAAIAGRGARGQLPFRHPLRNDTTRSLEHRQLGRRLCVRARREG